MSGTEEGRIIRILSGTARGKEFIITASSVSSTISVRKLWWYEKIIPRIKWWMESWDWKFRQRYADRRPEC